MDTPTQKLLSIKQQYYDRSSGKLNFKPVSTVINQYETILQRVGLQPPADMPYLPNIFVHALSEHLQRKLLSFLQTLPAVATYQDNLNNFNLTIKKAVELETQDRDMMKMVRVSQSNDGLRAPVRGSRSATNDSTASTFIAHQPLRAPVRTQAYPAVASMPTAEPNFVEE